MEPESVDLFPPAFTRVAVAAEGGSGLVALAVFALRIAAPDARLRLFDLVADPSALFPALKLNPPDWHETHAMMLSGVRKALSDSAKELAAGHDAEVSLLDLSTPRTAAPDALAASAREWGADLVAIAAHPRSHRLASRLDPEEVSAVAHCPVLYVPTLQLALAAPVLERVAVAIDGSAASFAALRLAVGVLPRVLPMRIVYVVDRSAHLWETPVLELFENEGKRALEAAAALARRRRMSVSTATIATQGETDDIASAILRDAQDWHASLVVLGLQGRRRRMHALPGSVTSRVLRDARCAVLVSTAAVGPDVSAIAAPVAE